MKSLYIITLLAFGYIQAGIAQNQPVIDPEGSSHFPNGTVYDPRAKVGKQAMVTNEKKNTKVDCEEFAEVCKEMLREAWASLEPVQPSQPGEGGDISGGTTDTGSNDSGSSGKKDNGKKGGKKGRNAYNPASDRWLDPEYRARLNEQYGIWHKNLNGQWIFIDDPETYVTRILQNIR